MTSSNQDQLSAALARQQHVLQFGLIGLGGLIAFAETRGDYFVGALIFNLVPFASLALFGSWFMDGRRVVDIVRSMRENGTEMTPVVGFARGEPKRMKQLARLAGMTFFVASVVGVILGFHELDTAPDPTPSALLWGGWLASAVVAAATLLVAITAALRIAR